MQKHLTIFFNIIMHIQDVLHLHSTISNTLKKYLLQLDENPTDIFNLDAILNRSFLIMWTKAQRVLLILLVYILNKVRLVQVLDKVRLVFILDKLRIVHVLNKVRLVPDLEKFRLLKVLHNLG